MIEDDPDFAKYLNAFFKKYDIKITNYKDPFMGLANNFSEYDLVILDLTFDGMDGLEVCQKIRKQSNIPIIISSARTDISDKIIGFENGADDYLPKPYEPKEMYIRILNLLKRFKKVEDKNIKLKSDFKILNNEISFKDDMLDLTKAEFEILKVLIQSFNHTISREHIVNSCDSLNDSYGKTLSTLIGRIKQKISVKAIVTVRGMGYKLIC